MQKEKTREELLAESTALGEELSTLNERLKLSLNIFQLLNQSDKKLDAIQELLRLIQEFAGFEVVAIRLSEGEDFPYYVTSGFPAQFVEAQRYLCARDQDGELIRDDRGNPYLECMCGNIIQGRTDPSLPFFTSGGSFWSNSTTALLASTTDEDRQARTRNRCNGEGYESVALVPLRSGSETIGLLQFNDRRQGMFTLDLIQFFQGIGSSIGIALARQRAQEALKASKEAYRLLFHKSSDAIFVHGLDEDGLPGKFIEVNEVACERLGYSREELLSLSPLDLGVEQYLRNASDIGHQVLTDGHAEFETVHRAKDGRLIPVESRVRRLDFQGQRAVLSVARDITERKRAEEEVEISQKKLRGLYGRVQAAREEDRARVAREIHDELGQVLTAAKIDLSVLKKEFSDEQGEPKRRLESALGLLDETMTMVRRISRDLRPSILDDFGLAAAIEWQAGEFEKRTGIQCHLDLRTDIELGNSETVTAIYRILQEALTNVARHADAAEVFLTLAALDDRLILTVRDTGRGITEQEIGKVESYGLLGMRERTELLGGSFTVKGAPGQGTTIRAGFPIGKTGAGQ